MAFKLLTIAMLVCLSAACIPICPQGTVYTSNKIFATQPSTFISEVKNGNDPRNSYCTCLISCHNTPGCGFVVAGVPSWTGFYGGPTWCQLFTDNSILPTVTFGTAGYPQGATVCV